MSGKTISCAVVIAVVFYVLGLFHQSSLLPKNSQATAGSADGDCTCCNDKHLAPLRREIENLEKKLRRKQREGPRRRHGVQSDGELEENRDKPTPPPSPSQATADTESTDTTTKSTPSPSPPHAPAATQQSGTATTNYGVTTTTSMQVQTH